MINKKNNFDIKNNHIKNININISNNFNNSTDKIEGP